jgi:hypothetical protein
VDNDITEMLSNKDNARIVSQRLKAEHFDFRFYKFGRQCWSLQFLLWGDGDLSSAYRLLTPDLPALVRLSQPAAGAAQPSTPVGAMMGGVSLGNIFGGSEFSDEDV